MDTINEEICAGENYLFNGITHHKTGMYQKVVKAGSGCETIRWLNLTVEDSIQTQIEDSIMAGDSVRFGNQVIKSAGTYYDTLTSSIDCDSIVSLEVSMITSLQAQLQRTGVQVYPNPAQGEVQIHFEGHWPAQLYLYDSQGRLVRSVLLDQKDHTLPFHKLEPGLYMMKIQTQQQNHTIQLVME